MQASICMTCVCICYVVDSPSALLNSFCHCCLSRIKTCRAILLSIDFIRSKKEKKIGLIGHTTYNIHLQTIAIVQCKMCKTTTKTAAAAPTAIQFSIFSFFFLLFSHRQILSDNHIVTW